MAPTGSRGGIWPFLLVILVAGLLLVLVGFNSQLLTTLQDFGLSKKRPAYAHSAFSSLRSSQVVHGLPSTKTVFQQRPVLENLSPAADTAWKQMALTPKGGFLWVESNQTSQTPYGISMFHGLHCLQMLRVVIRNSPMMRDIASISMDDAGDGKMNDNAEMKHPGMDPVHIGHCIGYIAQHLMCAADSTIELPWTTHDEFGQISDSGVDGEGYQHQCRDSSLLWEVAGNSEKAAVKPWKWEQGDTIESVFSQH